jgi:hypothetical protein
LKPERAAPKFDPLPQVAKIQRKEVQMTSKKLVLPTIVIAIVSTLTACGGGSASTRTAPPPALSIALQTGLPTSLGVSTGLQIAANVSNDPGNAGVDWTVTCGSSDCGSFSAAHTAGGTATTYTSPAVVPAAGSVLVTATSTKNSAQKASATFAIEPSPIAVSFRTAPPASMFTSGTASITANLANDTNNGGVDWTVSCGSSDCGSFSPAHTASGSATTYTAPVAIPTGGSVTIAATSTDDNTKSATAAVTLSVPITAYNQLLNGTYVFEISGSARASNPYQVGGVIVADGNGNITGGEQVYKDRNGAVFGNIESGTTYSFGTDGRGTISLHTSSPSIGVGGNETLGAVIVSSSKILITEFDVSATGRGSMDLQTAVNPLNGGYAFVIGGNSQTVFGGVFNVDNNPATGDISGAGSVADFDAHPTINHGILSGSVTAPDSLGQVTITTTTSFSQVTMTGYIVDDSHIKLIETDSSASSGGIAIAQGASTGTYTDNSALSGNLVYGLVGGCLTGTGGTAIAGTMTADGAGGLTGFMDLNHGTSTVTSHTMTGTYSADISGTGRISAATNLGTATGPNLIIYLTQPSLPALVMETDVSSGATGSASIQAAGPYSFNGSYGLDFSAFSGPESDGTAKIAADGGGAFSGTADVNSTLTNTPASGLPFTGIFNPDPSGRFQTTVTLNNGMAYSAAFYFIDSTQGFLIENDNQAVTFGEFHSQRSLDIAARRANLKLRAKAK